MADWLQESESSITLVKQAVAELIKLNPRHELLEFWVIPEGQTPTPEEEAALMIRFKDRFWAGCDKPWQQERGAIVTAVTCGGYYTALMRAIDREEEIAYHRAELARLEG